MNRTKIEWVRNPDGSQGYTCNPKSGCLNSCPYCYARKLAYGRLKTRYLSDKNGQIANYGGLSIEDAVKAEQNPFYPRFWPEKLEQIRRRRKSAGIFLDDMSDWAADYWPEEWTRQEFDTIRACPQHRFYLLTKQPQRLSLFSPFPRNCYVGVSVTANGGMTRAMTNLSNVKASVRFISFEPLLGSIGMGDHMSMKGIVDWVIIGLCTPYSPKTAPAISWIKEIVDAADKAGIAVFLKNNLEPILPKQAPFYYWPTENYSFFKLRQEFPKEVKV